ncbi:hypothetical protein GCM10010297_64300 [Streptomyces malachitofuscus]|nr:hypothetical protein GCM10010297_64300 [Streptomyces malachitofuscus]
MCRSRGQSCLPQCLKGLGGYPQGGTGGRDGTPRAPGCANTPPARTNTAAPPPHAAAGSASGPVAREANWVRCSSA